MANEDCAASQLSVLILPYRLIPDSDLYKATSGPAHSDTDNMQTLCLCDSVNNNYNMPFLLLLL